MRLTVPALMAVVLIATTAAAAAACGTSSAGSAAAGSTATGPCVTGALAITLDRGAAGVAAGTSLLPLDFTNTGSASCVLSGYPAVSFASGGGLIGQPGIPDRTTAGHRLALEPDGSAHVWLRVASAANFPSAACLPVTTAGFEVRLPGEPNGVFIASPVQACTKAVTGSDVLVVGPFQPGLARRGTA